MYLRSDGSDIKTNSLKSESFPNDTYGIDLTLLVLQRVVPTNGVYVY